MTSFGYATLAIIPSLSGLEGRIESQLSSSTLGQKAGAAVGKNMAAGIEKSTSTALSSAKFGQVFSASIRGNSKALTELGTRANAAGASIKTLATRSLALSGVQQAASGLFGSLGGLASMIGVGGPLALAVTGGVLAWNSYATAQENARVVAENLASTLDKLTGASTRGSFETMGQEFLKAFPLDQLRQVPFSLEEILVAVNKGGSAYQDLLTRIEAYNDAQDHVFDTTALERGFALQRAVEGLGGSLGDARSAAEASRAAFIASGEAYGSAADKAAVLASNLDVAAAASGRMVAGANAVAGSLFSVQAQADKVRAAINATPKNVAITAEGVGFSQLLAQIQAVQAALSMLKYGVDTTSPTYAGGDHIGLAADRQSQAAKDAQRRYDRAWNRIRKMQQDIDKHNVGVKTGASTSGGGGGGGRGGGAATAMMNARADLLSAIGRGFARSFIDSSPAQISKALADLADKVKAALGGKVENQLVARVKAANDRLRPLARQREAIADQLADATSNLANLRSSKASAVDSIRGNAIGSITERSWSAKGVAELLRRRLEHLRTFRVDLRTLAAKGLPQDFLIDLINAGPEAAWRVARNLVTADAGTFADIKSKALALVSESTSFGTSAASMMYDAGIKTAEGLVKGFESQQDKIEAAMLRIAKGMQKAIKKALGINSPSRVFRDLGAYVPAGFALGVDDGSPVVNAAVGRMVNVPSIPASVARSGRRQGGDAPLVGQVIVNSGDPVAVKAAVIDGLTEVARTMQVAR